MGQSVYVVLQDMNVQELIKHQCVVLLELTLLVVKLRAHNAQMVVTQPISIPLDVMHVRLVIFVPIQNCVQNHVHQEHICLILALLHATVVMENVQR